MTTLVERARDNAQRIHRGITGRSADSVETLTMLALLGVAAGAGDYLEIGSLFGASAIAVAMLRKEEGIPGKVVCIDPLDGYYMGVMDDDGFDRGRVIDQCGLCPSPELLRQNAQQFGVKLEIIKAKSYPFPIRGRRFVMSYIDGDHWHGAPVRDWLSVKDITDRFVVFDNWSDGHAAVDATCAYATADPLWRMMIAYRPSYVLERVKC